MKYKFKINNNNMKNKFQNYKINYKIIKIL